MTERYYVIAEDAASDVFTKVLEAKELIATKEAKDISEAVKMVGISRSVYYKYRDKLQLLTASTMGRKASLTVKLAHTKGTLSKLLELLSEYEVNILTIFQGLSIHTVVAVQLMIDISEAKGSIEEIMQAISETEGMYSVELLGID